MRQIVADGTHLSNDCIEPTKRRNSCKCKYKVRTFYSKGAFLVLIWNLLVSLSCWSLIQLLIISRLHDIVSKLQLIGPYHWLLLIPAALPSVAVPLSGWLADVRFGNYRVSKIALVILFLGAAINCILILIFETSPPSILFQYILFCIVVCLFAVGSFIYSVSTLQLGLDQMPDASASNITSFIAWFVFGLSTGSWIAELLYTVLAHCNYLLISSFVQVWSFFVTLCMSIVLISDFLLAPKWLIVEPKSPQSLKTIYRVLRFAVKHKAPIYRSALTYWEDNIPSRIDLGKSRYGGPFTTEQVENVKTVFRLLLLSLSSWVVTLSLSIQPSLRGSHIFNSTFPGLTVCTIKILHSFTYNNWWSVIIGTLIFEFAIYPLVRNKLPTILKKIGIASFLNTAVSFLCLILQVGHYFYRDEGALEWISAILYWLIYGLLTQILATSMLEFVCAQSPYNMRGLLAGCMFFVTGTAFMIGRMLSIVLPKHCHPYSFRILVFFTIKTVLGLIGFILHCILASWYKRRVRDDIYSPQTLVEEVYDRYLTAQNNTDRHATEYS